MKPFEIYYPCKPLYITQPFGSTYNNDYYHTHGINISGHNGTDYLAKHGQAVYASHDGIAYPEVDGNQGHGVVVITNGTYDYKGQKVYWKSVFWHLVDNIPVVAGQQVKAGDIIGYADSTGLSTGDHLHFSIKPLYKNTPYESSNVEQNNGYLGAVDPAPYLNGKFAEDIKGFVFNNDLSIGDTDEDVRQLQLKLQRLGYFPLNQVCTRFYGAITKKAVYEFQLAYIPNLSFYARYISKGSYCWEQTRAALNAL